MHLAIYQKKYRTYDTLDHFQELYYSFGMPHLASDLLNIELTPKQILNAVKKGMRAIEASGESKQKHFLPVYSERNGQIFRDCKLSDLGKALVLMNATPSNQYVAKLQLKLCSQFLQK